MNATPSPSLPMRRRVLASAAFAAALATALGAGLALAATPARAQSAAYPNQPIRIVVPYPAGGATDALARIVAAGLQQAWGQTVTVDNRAGGSGTIGTDLVAKAAPDGYTVLMSITALIQQPPLMKLPYDPLKDLLPVTEVARVNSALAVPSGSAVQNTKDFVTMVKANPGKVGFGSYGVGTSSHIQGSLLNLQAGLDMVHIPYKGSAPLMTDLTGGQVPAAFVDISSAAPHLKAGRIRALAVTGTARNKLLPDVPTLKELGFQSFEPYGWFGLLMPANTPKAVVDRFAAEARRALLAADEQGKIEALGVAVVGNTPEEFGSTLRNDAALYAKIIRDTKITLE